jgi:biopolymer transport protein ExbD
MLKSNHKCLVALSAFLFLASVTMLFGLEACGQQESELKIVDLEGDQVVRIDAGGAVFDARDKKVATVNDREGSFTFLKPQVGDNQKIVFKNDPAVQRDNDRYVVKIGDGATFDVKPDGSVLVNGQPWARVFGYTQNGAQKDRFLAAICIIPLVREGPFLLLPRNTKNAEPDRAIKTQSKIWIPSNDEIYVDDDPIQKPDFDSRLGERIDEFLKRPAGANKLVYIASSIDVNWGTVVNVINRTRERGVDRIGLIVEGNDHTKKRFLLQIPVQRDPNEDVSKLKPNPLTLVVSIWIDLQLKLNWDAMGSVNDPSGLTARLAQTFQKRKELHVYKPGMETRADVPEDERVEKTVVIKASRACRYGDVIKIIDAVKGTGANSIVLQVDDLPGW